ncbi:molybdopterin-dependent oxidoreductase alpha subunit [Rhodanobacter sp. ANJX3]|uniref:FdhF/YdeP family oxidoreductase n=1 Tax=Rhodanobacter sp. ANJX3 TaxID=2723083 RepID=UPI00161F4342|nr:FdhF/YdeP family oxidoreductase [Rhodanobacter sp. ANJX3]MBB5357068.1 molybdopterin-dependent oxidoreductase alpha subunit [Rhodanobacter sp. ANJX3]
MTDEKVEPVTPSEPAGGWGSLKGIGSVFLRELPSPTIVQTLLRQNKTEGFMCSSCAWGKPAHPHKFEFCENGAKSTIWELTKNRCTPEFFAKYTVTELLEWRDYDLEMEGRLTHPMRYDEATDKYVECTWEAAFEGIGSSLKTLDPKSVVFYASGKAGLEASYLYALSARLYGNNNLPDSSNMCHETTSVGLKKVIGSPVGTCVLEDFEHCDAIFYFGQNPGTNSPRFLHPLQDAVKRGCKIITFNPVREQGLLRFVNPQNPLQMLTDDATELSHMYLQVRPGGDIAALMGLCKHVLAVDAARIAEGSPGVLDRAFIDQHTHGFNAFVDIASAVTWETIEAASGLARADLMAAADVYIASERVIGVYGMGLTQHVHGSQSIGMLVNLMLLRGNIGRQGAGMSPVRGHSNVQGQRTVGISEKPELVPLDKLAEMFDFEPPREKGLTTVDACEGIRDGSVKGFISLGGNFVRAIPDRAIMEEAWTRQEITVYIATKLNRSHLVHGKASYLLPCLVRSEEDIQASGPQSVSIEDSFSHIYGSIGKRAPASEHLLSELAIIAGIAKATLPEHPKRPWDEWTADYSRVRDLIAETYAKEFHDFNQRMFQPGGFYRGNPAHDRIWKTESGRAEFTHPTVISALGIGDAPGRYHLITMRSNDQFNTTIYGFSDRLRGLEGSRTILLINPADMARAGLNEGDVVNLTGDAEDGVHREVSGLTVTPFNLPDGCLGGYYPEMNPLIPLWYHDEASKTPASKGVPVRIVRSVSP